LNASGAVCNTFDGRSFLVCSGLLSFWNSKTSLENLHTLVFQEGEKHLAERPAKHFETGCGSKAYII